MKGIGNKYISLTGEEEDRRLELQNKGLYQFDHEIYRKTLAQYRDPAVLDIGCGTGKMIHGMLGDIPSYRLFGVDEVDRQINIAKELFPDGHFYCLNVEDAQFFTEMAKIIREENISGFDVINCSMVILHLKDPVGILTGIHSLLSEKGTLIIRDIDDGLHFVWPDDEGLFQHYYDICARDARLGDRHCGRKLFHYLKRAGFSSIRLEKEGLSTEDLDDRMVLYDMFIPTTLHYMEQRYNENPDNAQWKDDFFWFRDNIDKMKQSFERDDFISSAGFVSFTAKK